MEKLLQNFSAIENDRPTTIVNPPPKDITKAAMADVLTDFYAVSGRALASGKIVQEAKTTGLKHKYADQVKGKEKITKTIPVVATNKEPQHPLKGRLVGEDLSDEEVSRGERKVNRVINTLLDRGIESNLARQLANKVVYNGASLYEAMNSVYLDLLS